LPSGIVEGEEYEYDKSANWCDEKAEDKCDFCVWVGFDHDFSHCLHDPRISSTINVERASPNTKFRESPYSLPATPLNKLVISCVRVIDIFIDDFETSLAEAGSDLIRVIYYPVCPDHVKHRVAS
jgi:hypothetical protein